MADEFDTELDSEMSDLDKLLESDVPGLEDPTQDDKPSISVVTDISGIASRNITYDKVSDSLRRSVSKGLPEGREKTFDDILDAKDTLVSELDKNVETMRKATANALGSVSEIAPDFIANPLKKLKGWISDDESYSSDKGPSEDQKILQEVEGLLGKAKTAEEYNSSINANVAELAQKQSNDLLANIVANTKASLELKFDIDNKYYRKDLELQMKQTLTLVQMLGIMKSDSEIRTRQMEAIVKNTGLPDFAKNRSSDVVKQMLINQAADTGISAFKSTNIYSKATKNISSLLNDKISTFVSGTEQLEGLTEMVQMNREMGINPINTLIDTAVGKGIDKVTTYGTTKLANGLMSNDKGQDLVKDIDKAMSDPTKAIRKLTEEELEKDPNSKRAMFLSLLNDIVPEGKTSTSYTLHNSAEVNQASFIDNKLKTSLTTVIPNLLSSILLEVKSIRKGVKTVDKSEKEIFDYSTNSFITKKELYKSTEKRFRDKSKSLVSSLNTESIMKLLLPKGKDKERITLAVALSKYLSAGKSPSPYYLVEDGLLNFIDDPKVRNSVKLNLGKLTKPKSKKDYENIDKLQTILTNIQLQISNHSDTVTRLKDTTDLDIYKDFKLTSKSSPTEIGSSNISMINQDYADKTKEELLEELEGKTKGFSRGGYTGKRKKRKNEVKGVVHEEEYVINQKMLEGLLADVKNANIESITDTVGKIASDVSKEIKDDDRFKDMSKSISKMEKDLAKQYKKSVPKDIRKSISKMEKDISKNSLYKSITGIKLPDDISTKSIKKKYKKLTKDIKLPKDPKAIVDTVTGMFSDAKDAGIELDINNKKLKEIIDNEGLDSVISKSLLGVPFPQNYSEALYLYKKMFNTLDPTGETWEHITKLDDYIENIQKIHIKLIEDRQKGLLGRFGERLDDGLDTVGHKASELRDKFINMLPPNLQPMARNLLDNRFTKLGGSIVSNLKKAVKGAGKATMSELRMVGKNVKDTFIDKDGKLHLPNAIDLAKLTGKTYWGTTKALSAGVKELYPAIYNVGKDTVKTATSTAWDMLGVEKTAKQLKNKAIAKIKPPIPRKLYTAWTSGKMTASEVSHYLTAEEKITWEKWLAENTRPGLTLPDMLMTTGSWYVDAVIGTSKAIKPTYSTIGGLGAEATKLTAKAAWKFTGIPDLFEDKTVDNKVRFLDIIGDGFQSTFLDSVNTIGEKLNLNTKIVDKLNEAIPESKSSIDKQIIKQLKSINRLYIDLNTTKEYTLLDDISKEITDLLQYLDSIYVEETPVTKVKKRTTRKKHSKKRKGFKSGGYTGDLSVDEEAGVVHGKEYVLNNTKLTSLVDSVGKTDVDGVYNKAKDIVKDVTRSSKEYKDKLSSSIKATYNNVKDKALSIVSSMTTKIATLVTDIKSLFSNSNEVLTSLKETLTTIPDKIALSIKEFTDTKDSAIERYEKLYGKNNNDNTVKDVVIRNPNTRCFGGKSCLTKLLLGITGALGTYLLFKNKNVAAYMDDIGEKIKYGYRYMKYLPEGIGLHIRDALSYLHLTKKVSRKEWTNHNNKILDIDADKLNKIRNEKNKYMSDKIMKFRNEYIRQNPIEKTNLSLEEYNKKVEDEVTKYSLSLSKIYDNNAKLSRYEREYLNNGIDTQNYDYNYKDSINEEDTKTSTLDKVITGTAVTTGYLAANKLTHGILNKATFGTLKGLGKSIGFIGKKLIGAKPNISEMTGDELTNILGNLNNKPGVNLPVPKEDTLLTKAWDITKRASKYTWDLTKRVGKTSWNLIKKTATSIYELKLPDKLKSLLTKLRNLFPKVKNILIKKVGKKAALKAFGKVVSKFLPGLGTALLAYDLYKIYELVSSGEMTLVRAFIYQTIGIDIGNDEKDNDIVETPDTLTPANNIITTKPDIDVNKLQEDKSTFSKYFSDIKDKVVTTYDNFTSDTDKPKDTTKVPTAKSNTTKVKLDTNHIPDYTEELETIKGVNVRGNSLLEQQLKVQANTYDRLGEILDVNKSMLEVLKGKNTKEKTTPKNNKHYNLPGYDTLVDNKIKNF